MLLSIPFSLSLVPLLSRVLQAVRGCIFHNDSEAFWIIFLMKVSFLLAVGHRHFTFLESNFLTGRDLICHEMKSAFKALSNSTVQVSFQTVSSLRKAAQLFPCHSFCSLPSKGEVITWAQWATGPESFTTLVQHSRAQRLSSDNCSQYWNISSNAFKSSS